jgi:phosphocarrier protein HPr
VSVPCAPADARGGGSAARSARAIVTIVNRRGLHARAAARFVKVAEQFVAEIEVAKDDIVVSGNSIMGLMVLAAAPGSQLEIRARGREAKAALAALVALVESGFDEE